MLLSCIYKPYLIITSKMTILCNYRTEKILFKPKIYGLVKKGLDRIYHFMYYFLFIIYILLSWFFVFFIFYLLDFIDKIYSLHPKSLVSLSFFFYSKL